MINGYKYTNDELYDLIIASNPSISQYVRKDVNSVILENLPHKRSEGYTGDFSQKIIFSSLGLHQNFCMSFDVELDDNYNCPSVGLTATTDASINPHFLFIHNNGKENGVHNNYIGCSFFSNICTGQQNYFQLKKKNRITVTKQGRLYLHYINGVILSRNEQDKDLRYTDNYVCLVWKYTSANANETIFCKLSNFELSVNDNAINPIVSGECFGVFGESVTLDASQSTQENGTVSYVWDNASGGSSYTENLEETKLIKLDLIGSQGGHVSTYHRLVFCKTKSSNNLLLADLYQTFKSNYISVTGNNTFYAQLFLTNNGLEQLIENAERPACLNSDVLLKNGLIKFNFIHISNANREYDPIGFNLAQLRYEGPYQSSGVAWNNNTRQDYYGICLLDRKDDVIEVHIGQNLKLSDGVSFFGGANQDIWEERYNIDYPLSKTTCIGYLPKITKDDDLANRNYTIMIYDENLCIFLNDRLVFQLQNKLIADLAPNFFNIFNYEPSGGTKGNRPTLKYLNYHSVALSNEDASEDNLLPIDEILAGNGASPILAIMIESSAFVEPICLYRGFKNCWLKDVQGNTREFKPTGMEIELPERKNGSADALSFGIGDVSGEVLKICEEVRASAVPAYITVLQYAPFNELTNSQNNAPTPIYNLKLFITSCAITTKGATFSAGWHDTLNAKFPFTRYTAKEFPGLKYVV